ncbi:MAG TPA: hypothetical protein PLJ74_05385 [Myxococcota bacterium]|nr:hypothetical protein [Myxococcota bacterium]
MLFMLDKILSILPANRWKSIIGFILVSLPHVIPNFPVGEAENAVTLIGQLYLSLGLIHRAVKNIHTS